MKMDERLRKQDQLLDLALKMGEDVEIFKQEVTDCKNVTIKMSSDTYNTVAQTKKETGEELVILSRRITQLQMRQEEMAARLKIVEDSHSELSNKVEVKSTLLSKVELTVSAIENNKLDILKSQDLFKQIDNKLHDILKKNDNISDQQISLENWVEKYLPLKLQHQIVETVGEVIPLEKREKFYDISRSMARVLRKDIIEDKGNSTLKNKVLDLITQLRLENDILVEK